MQRQLNRGVKRCWAVREQGRAAEAIACYEHVALLQPESAEAHANLASCYKDAARQVHDALAKVT